MQVVKREGNVVEFDQAKIAGAISRCLKANHHTDTVNRADELATAVRLAISHRQNGNGTVTVERIQDIVEITLIGAGFVNEARSYMRYRDEHAKLRQDRPIPDIIKDRFNSAGRYFPTELQAFQFYDKYARFDDVIGTREVWSDTVQRAVDFLAELADGRLPAETFQDIRQGMLNLQVLPSMRLLAMAGPAARRQHVSVYNCSYETVSDLRAFSEALLISMSGCGVGFSVERQYIERLPRIRRQSGVKHPTMIIEDTTEGWVLTLQRALEIWFDGEDVDFDYSLIRPAGAVLKTKGGRASGPDPLKRLLSFLRQRILARQGNVLTPLDAHDMMCAIGGAAVSGGTRRTAMLSLFDWDDQAMLTCKHGDLSQNQQRWNANNSIVLPDRELSQAETMRLILAMDESQRGEPGIFSRRAANLTKPERRLGADFGTNPCLTGDTLVAVADGRGHVSIRELAERDEDVPVYCLTNKGVITIRWMRHPRITGYQIPVYKVTLDDGSTVRTTEHHKFRLKSGEYREVCDLQAGDQLQVMSRYKASIKDVFKQANSRSQDYTWVNNGQRATQAEHRLIARFFHNDDQKIKTGMVVHHIDFDASNNHPDNLQIMTRTAHGRYHGDHMQGDNNPMVRAATEWSDEKWEDYRKKQRLASGEDSNPRYSGFTHQQLQIHALNLTWLLQRRFSVIDWMSYAETHGVPKRFSGWRQNHLGGIFGLAKWAASELGIDQALIDCDPRVAKSYRKYTAMGYDCDIINGRVWYNKHCEVCGKAFVTRQREAGVCSRSCAGQGIWRNNRQTILDNIQTRHNNNRYELQQQQLQVYSDLKFKTNRAPQKKEWVEACKQLGVSAEIARKSSPFRYYADLQEAAESYNHRVVSVEFDGYEDVYNGTVDDYHNFFVGAFEGQTKNGKPKWVYVNNLQCGEISLRDQQFCNLSICVARSDDTVESLQDKVRLATVIGTIQSLATDFPGLRPEWAQNCIEERLLGVDITGQMDCPTVQSPVVLDVLKQVAIATNRDYAGRLNINPSAATTCNKPSGNSSRLLDCAPGIHGRWDQYYIANVRVSAHSPIYKVLRDAGAPMDPENGQVAETANTWVVHFPVKSPDGAILSQNRSALEQCDYWKLNKVHWTEHNPSVTITYRPAELLDLAKWVYQNQDIIGGMAFLPASDAHYDQMPYETIEQAEYDRRIAEFPAIDWSKLYRYEESDQTEAAQQLACLSGQCDI